MKKLYWTFVIAVAVVASAPSAFAQCARGMVTVQGKIENLPPGTDVDVTVALKTPRGDFSKSSVVSNGQFRIDVDFSTLKSWSPLSGHHCSNVPTFVDVSLKHANQMLVQEELKFTDNFETRDSLTYNLKRELTLDASKKTAPGNGL
ncbi:MAG: hypothetical protein ABSB66_11640 [Candidatus Acidiferrales bacterium]|jgi:hypothetical protein